MVRVWETVWNRRKLVHQIWPPSQPGRFSGPAGIPEKRQHSPSLYLQVKEDPEARLLA